MGRAGSRNSRQQEHARRLIEQLTAEQRSRRTQPADTWVPGNPLDDQAVADVVAHAMSASAAGRQLAVDRAIDQLLSMADHHEQRTSTVLLGISTSFVGELWSRGWQPSDLVAYASRQLSPAHGELVGEVISQHAVSTAGVPVHPEWLEQLHRLGRAWEQRDLGSVAWLAHLSGGQADRRTVLEHLVAVLTTVVRLPGIQALLPPPGSAGARTGAVHPASSRTDPIDPKVLAKVRGLLAKAESTEFTEEAESLTVKAQQLMARHAIDAALVAAAAGTTLPGQPIGRRLHLVNPYLEAKAGLANAVAAANRCSAVFDPRLGFVTLIGFAEDLAVVDLLFTSLLAQATVALVAEGRQLDRSGASRTRSYRQSFLVAFSARIGQRLREAAEHAVDEARLDHGAAVLPVLASRDLAVAQQVNELFPRITTRTQRANDAAGWEAGRRAADRAELGSSPAINRGRPRQ